MLKHRLLTVALILPIIVLAIFFFNQMGFLLFTALIVIWSAWEWTSLAKLITLPAKIFYVLLIACALLVASFMPAGLVLIIALLGWVWALVAVITFAVGGPACGFQLQTVKLLMGFIALVPAWVAINLLRAGSEGPFLLFYVFLLVWAMDTGGYVVGRLYGKHLMIERVSPKKTWEGFVGGLLLTLLIGLVLQPFVIRNVAMTLVIVVVAAIFSVIGDLFESMLKRQASIKDSSNLLPGHGGILDRMDSIFAALPVMAFVLLGGSIFYQ